MGAMCSQLLIHRCSVARCRTFDKPDGGRSMGNCSSRWPSVVAPLAVNEGESTAWGRTDAYIVLCVLHEAAVLSSNPPKVS